MFLWRGVAPAIKRRRAGSLARASATNMSAAGFTINVRITNHEQRETNTSINYSGSGSVWLERLVRDQEVGGSNPPSPTSFCSRLHEAKASRSLWRNCRKRISPCLDEGQSKIRPEAYCKNVQKRFLQCLGEGDFSKLGIQ